MTYLGSRSRLGGTAPALKLYNPGDAEHTQALVNLAIDYQFFMAGDQPNDRNRVPGKYPVKGPVAMDLGNDFPPGHLLSEPG